MGSHLSPLPVVRALQEQQQCHSSKISSRIMRVKQLQKSVRPEANGVSKEKTLLLQQAWAQIVPKSVQSGTMHVYMISFYTLFYTFSGEATACLLQVQVLS